LIIEAFENKGIRAKIVAPDGSYFKLEKLIDWTVAESTLRPTTRFDRLMHVQAVGRSS